MQESHVPIIDRALWWQVCLNVAYVLVAGPRGLVYLLALGIGLAVDLPLLTLRLLFGVILGLLSTAMRAVLWFVRFGLRFMWVSAIMSLVWVVQSIWALTRSIARAIARISVTLLTDIAHPRTAWQRAVQSMHQDRERVRVPLEPTRSTRWPGDKVHHFTDACGIGLQRFGRAAVSEGWVLSPGLWRRLALWERHHSMGWLNITLPPHPSSDSPLDPRTIRTQLPLSSLGYLLVKVPLGGLALALAVFAITVSLELRDSGMPVVGIGLVLAAVFGLHLLARASAHGALRAFSPSAAVRRLQAAEAQVAQERGKAERAEQSRRDLIINVGHELRTPTASILGHVESVLLTLDAPDGHIPPDTLRSYLAIVQREAERLSALVDDLLAVARAERAELQLVVAPIDAAEVIDEVYQVLAPLAQRERQVMLVQEVQPGLPSLMADRQRLSQVLLNLVRNAITYTPAGGIVSIGVCAAADDQLLLTIADTGSGIAPADLERVFERFYRADASRARASGGFGLGLAIARDLVEAMGGTITAESVLGEGSSFHVRLPVAVVSR